MKKIEGVCSGENPHAPGSWIVRNYRFGHGGEMAALLLVSEEGEGSIEVMTRQEVQSLLIDMYNAAMDGPYIANSEAMRKVATKNKFTL